MSSIPELLAPAGNPAMLHAAVSAGADAVYLGMGEFNARRNADNFDIDTLTEACDYAHLRGACVYVALNTIILPGELEAAVALARRCARAGVDAFIVQDVGLLRSLRQAIPDRRLHASTQMSIHDADGVAALAELGISRVTLARELSIDEVATLAAVADACGMEVETFVHGALCVCYSGQCLMSSMIGGRSANRGLCAQPCRLPYELVDLRDPDRRLKSPGEHLLSPKDLCAIDLISELARAGVASLKVEGRMKSPEYVHTVVSVYREALDDLLSSEEQEGKPLRSSCAEDARTRLGSVFSRGFTEAYLADERGNDIMSYQRPNNRGQFLGRVKRVRDDELVVVSDMDVHRGDVIEVWTSRSNIALTVDGPPERRGKAIALPLGASASDARMRHVHANDRVFRVRNAAVAFVDDQREPRVPISGTVRIRLGEPVQITFWPTANPSVSATAEGVLVEAARTKAVCPEEVREHVDRLGQTPFALVDLKVDADEDAGIGFSQIHRVRAEALDELQRRILEAYDASASGSASCEGNGDLMCRIRQDWPDHPAPQPSQVCVLATNPECARAAKRAGADAIYVPAANYRRGQAAYVGCVAPDPSQAGYPKHCTIVIPAVSHGRDEDPWRSVQPGNPVLVDSLAGLYRAREVGALPEVGASLPITNPASVDVVEAFGALRVWLSPELNVAQIADVARSATIVRFGIKVAGAQELMLTEHCALMSLGSCSRQCATCARRRVPFALRDRKGYRFPVVTDVNGRTHVFNGIELDNVPSIATLAKAGVSDFMIDATLMTPEQAAQATGRVVRALRAGEDAPKQPGRTTGHLHRGVM